MLVSWTLAGIIKQSADDVDLRDKRMHFDSNPHMETVPKILDELNSNYWVNNARKFVQKQLDKKLNKNIAKNIILFLGDGMSVPTLAATRMYLGGEEKVLSFEEFPHMGMAKTYCVNYQVPDSACTATAYLTGVKGNYGTIGVNAQVPRLHCDRGLDKVTHTRSIAQWAMDSGKVAGLVTTTRVTHASPAGVYAHVAERDWENNAEVKSSGCKHKLIDDIAEQLIYGETGPRLKVVMGGGRRNFLDKSLRDEENTKGKRSDDKNLIEDWLNLNFDNGTRKYIWNKVNTFFFFFYSFANCVFFLFDEID